jgi:hypothetical protein
MSRTATKQISFAVTKKESEIIDHIADRARTLARAMGEDYPLIDARMDICATHANGNRLRLAELLAADQTNFGHDVFGIRRYLNRETGQLFGHFVPRFSA